MNNKLVPNNNLWYKIKRLFFRRNKTNVVKLEQVSNNFMFNDNLKETFKKDNTKKDLAEKLLYGEIGTSELNEIEVNEMTEYLKKDIKNMDNELLRIKQHILSMQKQLKQ